MDEKINNQSIERLDITCAAIKKLKDNKINKIGQLCKKSRTDLKELSFESYEINKIDIELQLLGLNLRNSY
jgi:DNA-directed RNA polymerase alpha subunit